LAGGGFKLKIKNAKLKMKKRKERAGRIFELSSAYWRALAGWGIGLAT